MTAALHEALAAASRPSLSAWRRVVRALDAVGEGALEASLVAVEAACAGFPDALRLASGGWLRDLFAGRPQPRLRVARAIDLTLQGAEVAGDRHAWTDAPELAQATIVRVYDDALGDAGLARWVRSPSHPRVVELALAAGIGDRGAALLAGDGRLAGLRSLGLFRNAIGPEGLAALIASPHLTPRLRRLLLGRNLFGEPGARALAGATAIAGLELLDLDCDRLDGPAVGVLAGAPLLAGVRALNLSNNPIGVEGCAALAASPRLGALEVLYLHGCGLDDAAARELLRAPWLPRLRNLALSGNSLSMASVEALAACRALGLDELDVCHNHFGAEEAGPVLRAAPQLAGLRRLCL